LPLPDDVIDLILRFLDAPTLARCEGVSRGLRALCGAHHWQELCKSYCWLGRIKPPHRTWKHMYRCFSSSDWRYVIVGGNYQRYGRQWCPKTGHWNDFPAMEEVRNCAAAVIDGNGDLMVLGGGDSDSVPLRSVECYVSASDAWSSLPPMLTPRCCASAALLPTGHVAVVGGGESMWANSSVWNSCEVYDPVARVWCPLPSLKSQRCSFGLARLATDTLYATGGYKGDTVYLDSVETFDVKDGRWRESTPLPSRSVGNVAAVGPDHALYVAGGGPHGSEDAQTDVLLRLDPRAGRRWQALCPMLVPRFYFAGAFAPDGRLYVAGGYTHRGQLTTAEVYDRRMDRWEMMDDFAASLEFCAGVTMLGTF